MSNQTQSQAKVETKWTVTPPIDVFENEDEYLLVGDLPGVQADQLDLRVERGMLIVDTTGASPEWEYRREFKLSDDVDTEAIGAKLEAGVLELRLPKRAEVRPRKISITTA
jgi:HSP20 family molecular chaperone IbpA